VLFSGILISIEKFMPSNNEPSDIEFDGYYNVALSARNRDRGHIKTVPKPPPLNLEEVNRIAACVHEIIFRCANPRYFNQEEIRNYYDSCVGKSLEDRTLGVSFLEPDDCTFGLLRESLQFLAREFPLWRIRIGGSSRKTTIIVYPGYIRFGTLKNVVREEDAFAEVLQEELILRNKNPILDQQRQVLKSAMASAIEPGFKDGPIIATSFDNYKGDFSLSTLWILCSKNIPAVDILEPKEVMAGDRYYVKSDGDHGYHVGEGAPYWVRELIFASKNIPRSLTLKIYDQNYQPMQLDFPILK